LPDSITQPFETKSHPPPDRQPVAQQPKLESRSAVPVHGPNFLGAMNRTQPSRGIPYLLSIRGAKALVQIGEMFLVPRLVGLRKT
jgi:hypothetical protein